MTLPVDAEGPGRPLPDAWFDAVDSAPLPGPALRRSAWQAECRPCGARVHLVMGRLFRGVPLAPKCPVCASRGLAWTPTHEAPKETT